MVYSPGTGQILTPLWSQNGDYTSPRSCALFFSISHLAEAAQYDSVFNTQCGPVQVRMALQKAIWHIAEISLPERQFHWSQRQLDKIASAPTTNSREWNTTLHTFSLWQRLFLGCHWWQQLHWWWRPSRIQYLECDEIVVSKLPVVLCYCPAKSAAADVMFDRGGMADAGVVLINYNHRAGSFGYLARPELSAEISDEIGHTSNLSL